MADIANVNGAISPLEEARVPATDRAFLYGDGVYETLRTYGGRPFLLERHLHRLAYSAGRLGIPLPGLESLAAEVRRTVAAAANPESGARVIVSRGSGLAQADPRAVAGGPNLVILVFRLRPLPEALYRDGTAAVVVGIRRNPTGALDPRIKSNNLLNNLLASMEAHGRGVAEGILLNLEGEVAEGNNSNVFLVDERGDLRTPSLDCGLLPGITREVVLELAREAGMPAAEAHLPADRLATAREIFLTSTTREILPVVRLDERPVGDGRPGPVTMGLLARYRAFTAAGGDAAHR